MNEYRYLTVAEFAEAANVSKQAIYKRLGKDLAPYVRLEGKNKVISTEALAFFNPVEQPLNLVKQPVEQLVNQNNQVEQLEAAQARVEELEGIIQDQKAEIAALSNDKTELNNKFIEMNDRLMDLLAVQMKQSENYQILIATQQKLLTAYQEAAREDKPDDQSVEQPANQPSSKVEQPLNSVEQPVDTPKKQSFWHRLFG